MKNFDFINYDRPVAKKVVLSESTKQVLKEEKVEIKEEDTAEEVVRKVNKTKRAVAKMKEDGSVVVKQSLQD